MQFFLTFSSGLVRGPGQLLREFNAENDEDDSEEDFDDESVHEEENIVSDDDVFC